MQHYENSMSSFSSPSPCTLILNIPPALNFSSSSFLTSDSTKQKKNYRATSLWYGLVYACSLHFKRIIFTFNVCSRRLKSILVSTNRTVFYYFKIRCFHRHHWWGKLLTGWLIGWWTDLFLRTARDGVALNKFYLIQVIALLFPRHMFALNHSLN